MGSEKEGKLFSMKSDILLLLLNPNTRQVTRDRLTAVPSWGSPLGGVGSVTIPNNVQCLSESHLFTGQNLLLSTVGSKNKNPSAHSPPSCHFYLPVASTGLYSQPCTSPRANSHLFTLNPQSTVRDPSNPYTTAAPSHTASSHVCSLSWQK